VRKTLYIGNLASRQDPGEVQRLVSRTAVVLNFRMMIHDDIFHRHGGFAVVEFESEADATRVAHALHGTSFHGTTLKVRAATAREETAAGNPRMFGAMNMSDDENPQKHV